jgi:hypothetical protein
LLFAAGIGGLITLIASALTFTIDRSWQVYKNLTWEDRVSVFELHSDGETTHLVITNSGDGPVFVSDINIAASGDQLFIPIERVLAPNEIASITKGQGFIAGTIIANESGSPTQAMSDSFGTGRDGFGHAFCFVVTYYSEDSPGLNLVEQRYSERGWKVVTEAAIGIVGYFSPHSKRRIDEKFAVAGAFLGAETEHCKSKFPREYSARSEMRIAVVLRKPQAKETPINRSAERPTASATRRQLLGHTGHKTIC